jgi:hypothetical protein
MPSLDYSNQVLDRTRGTPYEEQRAAAAGGAARAGAGFGSQSLPRQAAILQAWRGAARQQGSSPDAAEAAAAQLRQIHATQVQAYADNPWDAGARFARLPPSPRCRSRRPRAASRSSAAHAADVAVEAAAGGPDVAAAAGNEAASWADTLKKLRPWSAPRCWPRRAHGPVAWRRRTRSPSRSTRSDRATALMLRSTTARTPAARVAVRVGLGAQAPRRQDGEGRRREADRLAAEIATMMRGALGNTEAENDAIDAAYYVRASFDSTRRHAGRLRRVHRHVANAVRMVVGQPIDRGGVATILPRGMDERAFDTKLRTSRPRRSRRRRPTGQGLRRRARGAAAEPSRPHPDRGMRCTPARASTPHDARQFVTLTRQAPCRCCLKVQ